MIHGFGGTGLVFYRAIKYLIKYFRITTIDLFGLGASGRPSFNINDRQDCLDFFILSIEAWM
jgi:pimeloyl-ACP methyl ester carboxylesterase